MGRSFVRLCQTEDEWNELREVFVRAFMNYPLYQYIVQDETKRGEFIRRYMNALYEIHVRKGNSLLIAAHVMNNRDECENNNPPTKSDKEESKIIGGVLFVPPSKSGIGWDEATDERYANEYKKIKLSEVDEEAFERLKRYEDWETKNVIRHIMNLKIPLWNGLLCGVDPVYFGTGCSSASYADCMKIVSQAQVKLNKKMRRVDEGRPIPQASYPRLEQSLGFSERLARLCRRRKRDEESRTENAQITRVNFSMKLLHSFSFLTHHAYVPPPTVGITRNNVKPTLISPSFNSKYPEAIHDRKAAGTPMIIVMSHSRRAVNCYVRNGCSSVKEMPYNSPEEGVTPFSYFILFNDMFGSGRLEEISLKLSGLGTVIPDDRFRSIQ